MNYTGYLRTWKTKRKRENYRTIKRERERNSGSNKDLQEGTSWGIEEWNYPSHHSTRLAAGRGFYNNFNKVCLLKVTCGEDEDNKNAEFVSMILQEESKELKLLVEDKVDKNNIDKEEE